MKLLLTSAGITNQTLANELEKLVGKKPVDTRVAFIPTAANVEKGNKDWFFAQITNLYKFSFSYIDFVDPSASGVDWQTRLDECDVIFVSGGNTFHLLDQFKKTGLVKWLNEHPNKVYVGVSAGTIIATPTIEVASMPPADPNLPNLSDLTAMNWVNFEIEPHCDEARFVRLEVFAKSRKNKVYGIDDQSALSVINGAVTEVGDGMIKLFSL